MKSSDKKMKAEFFLFFPRIKDINNKKAISPIIATVLLIALVVFIWLIIFLWSRGLVQEAITKFDGKNIEKVCIEDVKFEVNYDSSSGEIFIENNGNVPIYNLNLKIVNNDGSYSTKEANNCWSSWGNGLSSGETFLGSLSGVINPSDVEKIIVSPILIGNSDSGKKTFECSDSLTGEEIYI